MGRGQAAGAGFASPHYPDDRPTHCGHRVGDVIPPSTIIDWPVTLGGGIRAQPNGSGGGLSGLSAYLGRRRRRRRPALPEVDSLSLSNGEHFGASDAPLLASRLRLREYCPACGIPLERREEGYQAGSYMFNIVASELLFLLVFLAVLWLTWPSLPGLRPALPSGYP
jgi:hypothetical protein